LILGILEGRTRSDGLPSRNAPRGQDGEDHVMLERWIGVRGRSLIASISLLATFAFVTSWLASPAEAYHRHHYWRFAFHQRHVRVAFHPRRLRPDLGTPSNFAAIVVDGNSGRVLYARNENELRHPASITKVMTLYLLFEELEKGRLRLDSRLPISEHAAEQAPTKLGLGPGAMIDVDHAIRAIVTLSANDIAVAIAEEIGGSEEDFAAMMTHEAHALGMTRTLYVNASGLPDDDQLTTAADLALLGRAIQERFPRYYHYFSTEVFRYGRVAARNHNHLLGRIAGLDGIKTGYTRESGFNLLTSVRRSGHFIIAVVLGGTTSASRDRTMAGLIETEIGKGSTRHTAPMIAEVAAERIGSAARRESEPAKTAEAAKPSGEPHSLASATPDTMQVASIPPMPMPRPAFVSGAPASLDENQIGPGNGIVRRVSLDGSTGRPTTSTTTPSMLRWVDGPPPGQDRTETAKPLAKAEPQPVEPRHPEPAATEPQDSRVAVDSRPPAARSGWMIQIGATDEAAKASALLSRAKARGLAVLDDAEPFTEKVQKGSETLYRARFAGLDADDAETACKSLKRSGFACFATKN
jgi:D-alanyl-D-alanine carboxypeptidase